jgi:hypothetical protein
MLRYIRDLDLLLMVACIILAVVSGPMWLPAAAVWGLNAGLAHHMLPKQKKSLNR